MSKRGGAAWDRIWSRSPRYCERKLALPARRQRLGQRPPPLPVTRRPLTGKPVPPMSRSASRTPHDFYSTSRSKPPQCAQEHRPNERKRKTAISRNALKHGLTTEGIELAHDPQAWQGCIGHERQAFPREVVDHSQDAKPPAIGKCVRQEIQAPALIGPLQSNIVSRDQQSALYVTSLRPLCRLGLTRSITALTGRIFGNQPAACVALQ
jgi:hypothetical protein